MQKTKIIIALGAVALLTFAIAGLTSAQISSGQTNAGTNPNNEFWGGWATALDFETTNPVPTNM